MKILLLLPAWFMFSINICAAFVPTAEEDCRIRNAAICELNGVPYQIEGPCPPQAKIIRPPGNERCEDLSQSNLTTTEQPPAHDTLAVPVTPRQDLARFARVERWLLPSLIITFYLLLAASVVWGLRWVWQQRQSREALTRTASLILKWGIAGVLAVGTAYSAASAVFFHITNSYNHDTAAPVLLAAPVALVVFLLVFPAIFFLTAWLLGAFPKKPSAAQRPGPKV